MKKHLSIGLAALVLFGSACKKALDLAPTGSIDPSKAFQTVADLNTGALGVYASTGWESSTYVGSIMSDEARISPENRGQGQFIHKWTHTSTDGDAARAWGSSYAVIDRVNRILAVIDGVPSATPTETATKDRIKGEMLALRALSHFELWRWYAVRYNPTALAVPVMTTSVIGSPARDLTSAVFALVEQDLVAAKGLIPTTFTDNTRMTRNAVAALQARVALYKGDWDNAITFSSEVITAVPLATRAQFPTIWTDAGNNEVLFKLKRVSGQTNTLWQDLNGDVFYGVSLKLFNAYDRVNDIRFSSYVNQTNRGVGKDSLLVKKYAGGTVGPFIADAKVIRVSEMYLIRAEAQAEKANLVAATADFNTLRAARIAGVPTAPTFANAAAAISEIYMERFRELPFEGHRYFDLKRRNLPIERDDLDVGGSSSTFKTLSPSSFLYLLPIPQAEIFANKSIEQNPGY